MISIPESVAQKLPHLPDTPGVYLWKGREGEVLYVGKAKRLRQRVRSYFATDHEWTSKTRMLVEQVADLETIVVPSDSQALLLEYNLIKEHRPRFNILLRDDKSYPYVKVTVQEPFPRVFVTRRLLDDGARYFGPYTDVGAMRQALNVVKRIFTVRSCRYDMPAEMPERACLDFYIKRCKGPCIGEQSQAEYRAMTDEVLMFLDGRTAEVMRRVEERMVAASDAMQYERAAEMRDALNHLQRMDEPSPVLEVEGGDRDVIGYARDGEDACVVTLRIRGGKLLGREHRFLEHVEEEPDAEVMRAYLVASYLNASATATATTAATATAGAAGAAGAAARGAELLIPFDFEDRALFEETIPGTRVLVPQRGSRRELLDLAEQNARHLLEEFKLAGMEADERAADPVYDLGRELGLQKIPRSLVCFDNSTSQGKDNVGSIVWFENGRPRRGEYRTMRVKTVDEASGPDDFASMREVVHRYFRRRIEESKPLPDLIVVDGGKGQLSAAAEALAGLGLEKLPLVSLAKREEEIFVYGRSEPLRLPRRSQALRLLQQARDEAHRTAVTYNRKRRTIRTVTSELLRIPGVGPMRRRALLTRFGSIHGVREATAEDIAALPGWSLKAATKVLDELKKSDPTAPSVSPIPSDS
jgi:excinuclease ABC subunit C